MRRDPAFRRQGDWKVADGLEEAVGRSRGDGLHARWGERMGRGELRGYDWAGLKLAVEVPDGVDADRHWRLPAGFVPDGDGQGAAVRVRLHEADEALHARLSSEGTVYFHEGDVFEAGRVGSRHWIRTAEDGRVAWADEGFQWIEIARLRPHAEADFPLARPLDDLVLIHRALLQGAFALRATAAVRGGRALVLLGDAGRPLACDRTAVWQGWLLLLPARDGVRVAPLPSTRRSGGAPARLSVARLSGLHVLDPMTVARDAVRVLDPDLAAAELLRYAFAPITSPDASDQLVGIATRVACRVPVVQIATAGGSAFGWRAASGVARAGLPAGA